jgi:hypothetical protein
MSENEAEAIAAVLLSPGWRGNLDDPFHPLKEMENPAHPVRKAFSGMPTKDLVARFFVVGSPAMCGRAETGFMVLQAIALELDSRGFARPAMAH